MLVNERIKMLMKKKGFSVQSLAQKAGTTQPNLSSLLSGKHSPNLASLENVASALGVELYELFMPSEPVDKVTAFVKSPKGLFYAESLSELKDVVRMLEPRVEIPCVVLPQTAKKKRKPKK